MPKESQRKRQFVKALYNPQVDFLISRVALNKHLDLILQAPWGKAVREGLYYIRGEQVRLKLNKMVINWTINTLIILTRQPSELHSEIINRVLAKLTPLLKDLYASVKSDKDDIETEDIWLDVEASFKKTFSTVDKEHFLGAVINASIIDLVSLRLEAFKAVRDDFKGFLEYDNVYDYRYDKMNFERRFLKNADFLRSILLGTTRFFNLILKDHETVASHFKELSGQLKNKQLEAIRLRTVPVPHGLGDLMNLILALLLAAIFYYFIGGKAAHFLTGVCWTYLLLGYYTHKQNNRDAKPEFRIRTETDYFAHHDAALERIYDCVNMQPIKIRYLETNKKVMFFGSNPPQKSNSPTSQSQLLEDAKLKSKPVKKDKVRSKSKSELIKEHVHHRRLPSFEWKNSDFPRFSESNGADPTKPFPVSIEGIPRGRIFCMFTPVVINKLQERGVSNLMEVASHSASSKGEQGIVKAKNFYATEDGIFEAVAKVKFLGSRGFVGAKGDIRIFMREATQGPDGEQLWIGDGFQSDHRFSNS